MKRLMIVCLALFVAAPLAAQERTTSPHGDLKTECAVCHRPDSWTSLQISSQFSHADFGFPLTGAHGATTCRACHTTLDFQRTSSDCTACHTDLHRGELGPNCARCHTNRSFGDHTAMTKAHQLTRFPLTGGHLAVDCIACHKPSSQGQMQFVGTPTTCATCHQAEYNTAPSHVAARYPTTCEGCHSTVVWNSASLGAASHPTTPIALTGVHGANLINCTQCHTTQPYSTVQQTCDGCHHADYLGAKDPDHVAGNFPTTCTSCHGLVAGWLGAKFDHPTSPVALTGAHSPNLVTCTQCHTTMPYSTVKQTCDGCHHAEYVATTSPSHVAAGYSTDCASCHQVVANWAGASLNHPTTPIALTGVHSANLLTCAQCHTTTPYSTVPQTCDGCHHNAYVAAKDPDHVAGNFSVTCTQCHGLVAGWLGATFSHPTTPIALTGAHSANLVTCAQCHTSMPYAAVQRTCDGCHHQEYVATTNPNHAAAGYSTDCATCHQAVANWAGATLNHPTTPIALTGVHSSTLVQCAQCHTTMPYATVQRTCDGCHHAEFTTTTDPNHVMANFSVTCTNCHGLVAGWTGARFTAHDGSVSQFRIYSGKHQGKWGNCAECHRLGQPYASTPSLLCLNCHGDVQTDEHRGKNYTPTDCVRSGCHANGSKP